jgi:hypothetical protein
MTRLASLTAFMAVLASTTLSALEIEPQSGGLVFGNDTAKDYSLNWHGGLANKQMDQGWARSQDAVFQTGGTVRYWGLGATIDVALALGQDRSATYVANTDPNQYASRPIQFGETIQLNAKFDYLMQIDGVYGEGVPFLQLDPHLEFVTYPNQPPNTVKDDQVWLGTDLWLSAPFEELAGVDFGGSIDYNISDPALRSSIGFRELKQYAPYELLMWQYVNLGNRSYHGYFTNTEHTGLTTSQIGAKIRSPMAWNEWWAYAAVDWSYWLQSEDRDYRKALGQDAGELAFTVGIEWRAP